MAVLKLNELLDLAGNKLDNGVLVVKEIGDATTVFVTGEPSIKKIEVHVNRIKFSFSGGDDNRIEVIELKQPGIEFGARNIREKTLIVVNKTATILQLVLPDLAMINNSVHIDLSKLKAGE